MAEDTEESRTREELASTIALLQAALDATTEGLLVVGQDGRVTAWNRRFAEMVQVPTAVLESRSREHVIAHLLEQLDDPAVLVERVRWLDEHPEDEEHGLVLRLRDGRIVECHCRLQRLDGAVIGRVWSLRDVTGRHRTEAVLRESEERYRSLYTNTPVMMHSIDAEGRLVSVSNTWLERLGYTREDVIGRKSVEFLAPESREYARKEILPAFFATGACKDVPYRIISKSGELVDVLLSAICERDAEGKHLRSLAVLIDVTRRKRAEAERDRLLGEAEAARESAESALALLDTVLMTAPIGLGFLDRDLRYVRVNTALAAMHAVEPAADIGRTIWEAVPEIAPRVAPLMRHVLDTGEPVTNVEITGTVPGSSEVRSWLASWYPVRTAGGKLPHVGVVVVDMTERKRAEETQARLYREAQEAIRVRDDFLAIASHELKTPLTPLALRLQLIERKLRQGEGVAITHVEKALGQLDRVTNLINDLLDVSRIQAGRLMLHPEPVSLRAIVEQMVTEHHLANPAHPVTIDAPDDDLVVTADRSRLTQVIVNLLDNAAKYSPSESPIRVRLARREGEALLSVTDEGIGLPKEQQPMLFERFFRAKNAPISGYGGLGLGLYISRDIVERHGGRIWVESEVGRGSTFHVALPLDPSCP